MLVDLVDMRYRGSKNVQDWVWDKLGGDAGRWTFDHWKLPHQIDPWSLNQKIASTLIQKIESVEMADCTIVTLIHL